MDLDFDDFEDDTFEYKGEIDADGNPHGEGILVFKSENEFKGCFVHGKKEGEGIFAFTDGGFLEGMYRNDSLHGLSLHKYDDGSVIKNTYANGVLEGESLEYDARGRLTFRGNHKDGVRNGLCWFYFSDGGLMCGFVNANGDLTGKNIAYIYPDSKTALIGHFDEGELVSANLADVVIVGEKYNEQGFPEIKKLCSELEYRSDISTLECLSRYPILQDPYETKLVYVEKSNIEKADEGLFAKQDLLPGTVVAFYNGIRVRHKEIHETSQVNGRSWDENSNSISLDDSSVLDFPLKYSSASVYCASLGHKVNHSFDPNCCYDLYHHPRFGAIKCIQTIKHIKACEELTVYYTYEHDTHRNNEDTNTPLWYREQLTKFGIENAAVVLENINKLQSEFS